MGDESTRWTVVVSKETDIDLRSHLARLGLKKGDLSKFVEEAVRWSLFKATVDEARIGFEDMQPDEISALIDEALTAVRANPKAYDRDP